MTALQVIIKEAQAIRRKSPKMEWKKAVAQASAIYANKHKGKSPVGKKHAKKKAVKRKVGAVKKAAKKVVKKVVRKKAVKKVVRKKAAKKVVHSLHKDTASHNVKISVMSGIEKDTLRRIADINSTILMREGQYRRWLKLKKEIVSKEGLGYYKNQLKAVRSIISELKKHKSELKKHI